MKLIVALYSRLKSTLPFISAALACLAISACEGFIYEYEGDCSTHYRVKFCYDWNMKFADAFAHEVSSVTLYLIDGEDRIVWSRTEAPDESGKEDYYMEVDVAPGVYDLVAWCGTVDKASFEVPEANTRYDLKRRLRRETDGSGAHVRDDIDRLFYGYAEKQVFSDAEGTHTITVHLKKDTNSIRVLLQHLSGEDIDPEMFSYVITDENGSMDWDNSLMEDEVIDYHAFSIESASAEFENGSSSTKSSSVFSAALAEFSVPRLMLQNRENCRLTIKNRENEKTVLSIRLVDMLLLVKGYYNRDMDDQEYLDRQDEYSMVFFIDEGYRWADAYIYINSWKVVLQDTSL